MSDYTVNTIASGRTRLQNELGKGETTMRLTTLQKAFRTAISATSGCIARIAPDLRQWSHDLRVTLEAGPRLLTTASSGRLSKYLDGPELEQAHAIRRLRNVTGFVCLFLVVILITQIYGSDNARMSFNIVGPIMTGLGLAILCWRLAVRSSIELTKRVHQWALETQDDPSLWLSQPADASAVFAPWIPRRSMVIRRSWKKLKRRLN